MILDLFSYFAKFPSKSGVLSIFNNGSSTYAQYSELHNEIANLPEPLVPAIQSYVFGQSFESVKARIDNLTGTYLFIDYGEFSSKSDNRNSIVDTQKVAATIAMKLSDTSDLVEEAIASAICLNLLNTLRAHLLYDAECGKISWLSRSTIKGQDIIPFVAKELKSIGWTMMFEANAADLFNVKERMASF
jgi:hypothetical protein|nr:MAG TPA: hypothetical protein [Caudoviricetes sp.]